ncbi:VOC family protein [Paenibacillus sp. N3/727]|uniref:VOC family protein n=1 Tax=Paenibacillus sp. N3/727 TaxID=2925845 RepID=UPI001F53091C|nr:VOC family protein [Paenibacillus sp. N3/727]UNK16891.1 VOC family protein [Paenibacillus sp. N3/727]
MKNEFLFTRVGYVYVPTSNIDASIEWYTKHLEFQLIDKFQDRGSFLAVLHHPGKYSIALLLIETEDQERLQISRNGQLFPIMAMNCPDIEQTHEFLKTNGVDVQPLQSLGAGEAMYFYFRDNEGNLLEAAWSIYDLEEEMKEDFVKESAEN